jgi:undecaprenyl-diphosphatase
MDSLIAFGAKYLFVLVVLIAFAAWLQAGRRLKKEMILAGLLAGAVAAVLDKLSGALYYDPRPFVTHHVTPLVAHAADNGFPSEHTLFSAALAATLFFYRPRLGIAAMVVALLVGISRIAAHVHSPIDIAGGLVLGALAGYMGYWLARNLKLR